MFFLNWYSLAIHASSTKRRQLNPVRLSVLCSCVCSFCCSFTRSYFVASLWRHVTVSLYKKKIIFFSWFFFFFVKVIDEVCFALTIFIIALQLEWKQNEASYVLLESEFSKPVYPWFVVASYTACYFDLFTFVMYYFRVHSDLKWCCCSLFQLLLKLPLNGPRWGGLTFGSYVL